ncbi:hypothetical protein MJD09_08345 [bacterium]|nr:hypothetical protein [bacterium]
MNKMISHALSQDQILIEEFDSSCALKREIRNRVQNRKKQNWNLRSIKAQGRYLSLIFECSN